MTASEKKTLRRRVLERRKANENKTPIERLVNPVTSPRYDDVYYAGMKWLDEIARS
jgi:hypothetical protein